jgi:hypothetical protein
MGEDPHAFDDFSTSSEPDAPRPAPEPSAGPEPVELPEEVRRVSALFASGDLAAATRALDDVPEEHRRTMRRVEATLRARPFPIARARLKWAAEQNPELRAVIEACTPTTDPGLYRPDRNHDGWQPPRNYRRRVDPARKVPPDPQQAGPSSSDRYFQDRPDLTDPWAGDRIPQHPDPREQYGSGDRPGRTDAVSARWSGDRRLDREPGTGRRKRPDGPVSLPSLQEPQPYGSGGPDHERMLLDPLYDLPCVGCGFERSLADHPPARADRRDPHDDGLCGECRSDGITGIPPHHPDERITARAAHIAGTRTPAEALALLRRDWARLPLGARLTLSDWVTRRGLAVAADSTGQENTTQHSFESEHAPSHTGSDTAQHTPETASGNPLLALTDDQLTEGIEALQQRLALTDTDTDMFNPPVPRPDSPAAAAEAARRHHAAQDAIRAARAADHDLATATRALHATGSALHTARTELDNTPAYKRAGRRALRARIETLITDQRDATDARDTARTTARDAARRALHLAGQPEQWDAVLTRPAPNLGTADIVDAAEIAREIRDRIDDIDHQLADLHSERHRRAALSPHQHATEQRNRQTQPIDPDHENLHEPATGTAPSPGPELGI